mgnify:CR=1 FL=1
MVMTCTLNYIRYTHRESFTRYSGNVGHAFVYTCLYMNTFPRGRTFPYYKSKQRLHQTKHNKPINNNILCSYV